MHGQIKPGVIAGYNRLTERVTGSSVEIPMIAVFADHDYQSGYVTVEVGQQGGSYTSARSGVVEGRHRLESAEVRYTGWSYATDFIDLTAGSKAGNLSRADTLEAIGFTYNNRRAGQSGLLVKTTAELSSEFSFTNSLLWVTTGNRKTVQQFGSSLIRSFARDYQFRLSYLGKWRSRSDGDVGRDADHRFRLEGRFRGAEWYFKCYIGYHTGLRVDSRASLFATADYRISDDSHWQIWSNLGRIDTSGVEYWYLFICGEWTLIENLRSAVKLSNTYRRDDDNKNTTQLSLELTASL